MSIDLEEESNAINLMLGQLCPNLSLTRSMLTNKCTAVMLLESAIS
jgi:hypothetical protein